MSHFKLLAIGNNYKTSLEKYNESENIIFIDKEDEYQKEYLEEANFEGQKYIDIYPTFEQFMSDWYGEDSRDEEFNKYGIYCNPDAQWDWYKIGGRYDGALRLTEEALQVRNDSLINDKPYLKEIILKDVKVESNYFVNQATYSEIDWNWYKLDNEQRFNFFALLKEDGIWIEKGKMGWFGRIDTTEESKNVFYKELQNYLETLDSNTLLTVIDCHI